MKVGVITSGYEMLYLFKYLQQRNHQYEVVYDFLYRPYGERDFDFVLGRIIEHVEFLVSQGAECVLVPPVYELALLQKDEKYAQKIYPLFTEYLTNYCFKYSLVGKIGVFGDSADIQQAQALVGELWKKYALTPNQQQTKKFQRPFAFWCKETPMLKYFLTTLSYSDFMANKQVKLALRYFKDAAVDTLIPLNYAYFAYQKTISNFFNYNKTRFHRAEKLFDEFAGMPTWDTYSVKIFYTGYKENLERDKRMMWVLGRGKSVEVEFVVKPK